MRRSCTDWSESRKQADRRIDAMLRELVVEEGIKCWEHGTEARQYSLQEIADYVGASVVTMHRIEQNALKNLQKNLHKYMLELGVK